MSQSEPLYSDDPNVGHPDVRTVLEGVSYFLLGNGLIQAIVQLAPSGQGTPLGLAVLNPDRLGKKRESLSFDPESGLEKTMLRLRCPRATHQPKAGRVRAAWAAGDVPTVEARWQGGRLRVRERFFCPDRSQPLLLREIILVNTGRRLATLRLETGLPQQVLALDLTLAPGEEKRIHLSYRLEGAGESVQLAVAAESGVSEEALRQRQSLAQATFGSRLLDHFFQAARDQLGAAVSRAGTMDGSLWQYCREWPRDQAWVALALTMLGERGLAQTMLDRILGQFVSEEGDTIDSGRRRQPDEVELDQNGALLYILESYVLWTGDRQILTRHWPRLAAAAEYPLRAVFGHEPSGLLANAREYWERHRAYGIDRGLELAYQLFPSLGLAAAARLAREIGHEAEAQRWQAEAARIREALLNDPRYALVDARGFIKRRSVDGTVQETIDALPGARLPESVPLAQPGPHYLNPDTSTALPIVTGFVDPQSPVARATLAGLETLWNQAWQGGGYGRYHITSEPDSPGAWPFASLFVARAALEAGEYDKVWRVLRWLESAPGGQAGTWFEYYGPRCTPPFPQVGIVVWTWAEMLFLLIHHIMGVRPEAGQWRLRPRLLPGIEHIRATLPLRDGCLELEIERARHGKGGSFRSSSPIIATCEREATIAYGQGPQWVRAVVP